MNSGIPLRQRTEHPRRSYTITADVDVPQGGGDGMLVTDGRALGRLWAVHAQRQASVRLQHADPRPVPLGRRADALTPGKHTIVFDYTYDGPGIAKGGTGVLKVDGKVVATQKQANSIAFLQVADETFDVGVDTRTGVNDKDYQVPFPFNGTIDKLTVKLGPSQLTPKTRTRRQVRQLRRRIRREKNLWRPSRCSHWLPPSRQPQALP